MKKIFILSLFVFAILSTFVFAEQLKFDSTTTKEVVFTKEGVQHTVSIVSITPTYDSCKLKIDGDLFTMNIHETKIVNGVEIEVTRANKTQYGDFCDVILEPSRALNAEQTNRNTLSAALYPNFNEAALPQEPQPATTQGSPTSAPVSRTPPAPTADQMAEAKIVAESSKCLGCVDFLSKKCLPIGKRIRASYCDTDKQITPQKIRDVSCGEHYECVSNLCNAARSTCMDPSIWRSFMNWLAGIFS